MATWLVLNELGGRGTSGFNQAQKRHVNIPRAGFNDRAWFAGHLRPTILCILTFRQPLLPSSASSPACFGAIAFC